MSAAKQFALEPTGPRVNCDFRGCVLEAWHDGNHDFGPQAIQWTYDRHCVVCGVPFTILGADKSYIADTCGSAECLLHYARRWTFAIPVLCRCPQWPYAHELAIHHDVRSESYNPKFKFRWPWSLCLSVREEPSTERKAA